MKNTIKGASFIPAVISDTLITKTIMIEVNDAPIEICVDQFLGKDLNLNVSDSILNNIILQIKGILPENSFFSCFLRD
jgi:hypothetical protein